MSVSRLVLAATGASIVAAAGAVLLLSPGCSEPPVQAHTIEHLSPAYTLDRVYKSMKGPSSTQTVSPPPTDASESCRSRRRSTRTCTRRRGPSPAAPLVGVASGASQGGDHRHPDLGILGAQ